MYRLLLNFLIDFFIKRAAALINIDGRRKKAFLIIKNKVCRRLDQVENRHRRCTNTRVTYTTIYT